MKLKERLEYFFDGICMGLADIIPGVSGGTIALIIGIYERLIETIESVSPKKWREIDYGFIVPLGLGIAAAFLAASRVILFLLHNYESPVYAFFFGLISASAILVYRRTSRLQWKTLASLVAGFLVAFLVVGVEYFSLVHSPPVLFFSGFLAICAMLLPGVSGSFMLLMVGQYEYMLGALQNVSAHWTEITVFMLGALTSLFTFSRVIGWFLENHEEMTLTFLTGMMIGALRLPATKIKLSLTVTNILSVLIPLGIGVSAVLLLERKSDL
ncbi:MAG: DUF368 domain-containing protein [Candidatus Aenigmatarchaeota archaeon]